MFCYGDLQRRVFIHRNLFRNEQGVGDFNRFYKYRNRKSLTEAFQYLLESDAMRRTVLDAIGETEFSGTITTSQLPETNIMSLTVTSDSPGLTFKIIRAVINNHHLITDNVMSNAAMDVLMQPTVPKAPTHALNRRSSVIKYTAILFAVIVSATVVYIIFSDKVRSERDLSALLPGYERLSTFGCENTGAPFAAASAAAAAQKSCFRKPACQQSHNELRLCGNLPPAPHAC